METTPSPPLIFFKPDCIVFNLIGVLSHLDFSHVLLNNKREEPFFVEAKIQIAITINNRVNSSIQS